MPQGICDTPIVGLYSIINFLVGHNFADFEVRRTVSDFRRCSWTVYVPRGPPRHEDEIRQTIILNMILISFPNRLNTMLTIASGNFFGTPTSNFDSASPAFREKNFFDFQAWCAFSDLFKYFFRRGLRNLTSMVAEVVKFASGDWKHALGYLIKKAVSNYWNMEGNTLKPIPM